MKGKLLRQIFRLIFLVFLFMCFTVDAFESGSTFLGILYAVIALAGAIMVAILQNNLK